MNFHQNCHILLYAFCVHQRQNYILALLFFCLFSFKNLFAQSAQISFQSENGTFCAPSNVKIIPSFSSEPIYYYWQIGPDLDETDAKTPIYSFSTPGIFKVTLIALFENKILEVNRSITIHGPPELSILPEKSFLCKPGEVSFQAISSPQLNSLSWDFGDNSIPESGPETYIQHLFTEMGTFKVSIFGYDKQGCIGQASTEISIKEIEAQLVDTPQSGCLPATVFFGAKVDVPAGSAVVSYVWNFDDGSPLFTSSTGKVSHVFIQNRIFTPTVSITTSEGCKNTFTFREILFGEKLAAGVLQVDRDTFCHSYTPTYFLNAVPGASAYLWDFDDDIFTTQDTLIKYTFNGPGTFKIKVSTVSNGCQGGTDSIMVRVIGVVSNFRFNNDCDDRAFFSFRSTSVGPVNTFLWTFGINGPTSNLARPTFRFPESGSFPVSLVVGENATGCLDSLEIRVYTAKPQLVGADTFICRGSLATLSVTDNYTNPRAVLNWQLLGRNLNGTTQTSFSTVASNPGFFNNRLIIDNGTGYCRDTLFQPDMVRVAGPVAAFELPPILCFNEPVSFHDQSSSLFPSESVSAWSWDFGNNNKSDKQKPDPVDFIKFGNYPVKLIVTDTRGCQDSITNIARIRRIPLLGVIPEYQKVCAGKDFELIAFHRSPFATWSPASQVSCITCDQVTVRPSSPSSYTVSVKDTFGCVNSKTVNLDVWQPFSINQDILQDTSVCIGKSVQFNLDVSNKIIEWQPASGLSATNIINPIATPLATTNYQVTISDSGRCFPKVVSATVKVNPNPVIDPGPDLILPYDALFTIKPFYGPDIVSYRWQPAGLLSCFTCPEPSGRARQTTSFVLTASTSHGCTSTATINLSIECNEKNILMPTAFTPDGNGLNDRYYPLTRGVRKIIKFVIYNRLGELVYEQKNFSPNENSFGWDGTFRGFLQPPSGFVYFLEAECDLGQIITSRGNFAIVR